MPDGEAGGEGASHRRRERGLRSWLRHERQSVTVAPAEFKHHSAWGQRMVGPRGRKSLSGSTSRSAYRVVVDVPTLQMFEDIVEVAPTIRQEHISEPIVERIVIDVPVGSGEVVRTIPVKRMSSGRRSTPLTRLSTFPSRGTWKALSNAAATHHGADGRRSRAWKRSATHHGAD